MSNFFESFEAPLFAADFHYFRIPREKWELMLTRLKQMGVNAISVTLPWGFHEKNRGKIDLSGTTNARHDAAGLINLCTAFDFYCILKPGPYSNSGVLGNGIPTWLLRDPDNFDTGLPAAVENWYKTLSKALTVHQWPNGPIIAIQVESEPAQGQHPPYSKQLTEVKWRIWLRKRYDGIGALNAAYGTNYRTVNDVEFPQTWTGEMSPLEMDAQEFLEKVRADTVAGYTQLLVEAGWQVPICPSVLEIPSPLPAIHAHSLTTTDEFPAVKSDGNTGYILNLEHPIQVDPDPAEVGCGPAWATNAPIRTDGSVRPKFWQARHHFWPHTLPDVTVKDKRLVVSLEDDNSGVSGLVATCIGDASLNIATAASTKSTVYRLKLNGDLIPDDRLKVARGKLTGSYVAEDDAGQTDLVLLLSDTSALLSGFPLTYLSSLLTSQAQTLLRCARLAESLGKMLAVRPSRAAETAEADRVAQTSYILEEARRGLNEAETALRKAMTSIQELEGGFGTILGREPLEASPPPGVGPVSISPEIFEDRARELLVETGAVCTDLAPKLKSAATTVQNTIDTPNGFSLEQYRQSYATATAAAQSAREPLLELIAQFRLEIASERLPLVLWRIHDQVQEIAESLRWGVLFDQVFI